MYVVELNRGASGIRRFHVAILTCLFHTLYCIYCCISLRVFMDFCGLIWRK